MRGRFARGKAQGDCRHGDRGIISPSFAVNITQLGKQHHIPCPALVTDDIWEI
ncbi:MAG: hypothetical protein AAFY20_02285 [Cyanobacteria bacterium J06639_14]